MTKLRIEMPSGLTPRRDEQSETATSTEGDDSESVFVSWMECWAESPESR